MKMPLGTRPRIGFGMPPNSLFGRPILEAFRSSTCPRESPITLAPRLIRWKPVPQPCRRYTFDGQYGPSRSGTSPRRRPLLRRLFGARPAWPRRKSFPCSLKGQPPSPDADTGSKCLPTPYAFPFGKGHGQPALVATARLGHGSGSVNETEFRYDQ